MVTEIMIQEGHAVKYDGKSKLDIEDTHLANREKLLNEGVVDKDEYLKAQG